MKKLYLNYNIEPLIGLQVKNSSIDTLYKYRGEITGFSDRGIIIKKTILKNNGIECNNNWYCTIKKINPIKFGADGETGELTILDMPVLKKYRSKQPNWVPFTTENQIIGAFVSNITARRKNRQIAIITKILLNKVETKNINPQKNKEIYNNIFYSHNENYYTKNSGKIFIDINNLPKQPKFHCIQCHKPRARYKKAICKECSLIPF